MTWHGFGYFKFMNGVIQDEFWVQSFFCLYIDDMLQALSLGALAAIMGNLFLGVLAYTNDILLAPTPKAMTHMLSLCD